MHRVQKWHLNSTWNCTWPRFIIRFHRHKVLIYRELICWQYFFREVSVLCWDNLHMATSCNNFKKEARKMKKRWRETSHKFQSNKVRIFKYALAKHSKYYIYPAKWGVSHWHLLKHAKITHVSSRTFLKYPN